MSLGNEGQDYEPTPEEVAVLQSIPRDFIKFGALGFTGGALSTHLIMRATIPKVIKRSFAVSYGTPVGVGMLVGVVWGINKMVGHVEHLVYDMPTSPLTHVYRKKFLKIKVDPTEAQSAKTNGE